MKYVSMRMPDPGPFGETRVEAKLLAIVAALLVNKPSGGCVESVFTFATHLFLDFLPRTDDRFLAGIARSPRTHLDAYIAIQVQAHSLV